MKNKIILSLLALTSSFASSQVIIGDEIGTAKDKTSVLLEFSQKENRGIILPYITTLQTSPAEGSIILDATDSTNAQVKYYNGTEWISLSQDSGNVSSYLAQQPQNITEPEHSATIIRAENPNADGVTENSNADVDANGVLVLESKDKALVLPTVSSVNEIASPSPGMMVYVSNDTDRLLAVFNGSKWSFWSATE